MRCARNGARSEREVTRASADLYALAIVRWDYRGRSGDDLSPISRELRGCGFLHSCVHGSGPEAEGSARIPSSVTTRSRLSHEGLSGRGGETRAMVYPAGEND